MNEPGVASLWIQTPEGELASGPTTLAEAQKLETHVIILQVATESGATLNLVFRKGEFSLMCAHPNTPVCIEVAVSLERE